MYATPPSLPMPISRRHHHKHCLLSFLHENTSSSDHGSASCFPPPTTLQPAPFPQPGPGVPAFEQRVPVTPPSRRAGLSAREVEGLWYYSLDDSAKVMAATATLSPSDSAVSPRTVVPPQPAVFPLSRHGHPIYWATPNSLSDLGSPFASPLLATKIPFPPTPRVPPPTPCPNAWPPAPLTPILPSPPAPPTPFTNAWPPALLTPTIPPAAPLAYSGWAWTPERGWCRSRETTRDGAQRVTPFEGRKWSYHSEMMMGRPGWDREPFPQPSPPPGLPPWYEAALVGDNVEGSAAGDSMFDDNDDGDDDWKAVGRGVMNEDHRSAVAAESPTYACKEPPTVRLPPTENVAASPMSYAEALRKNNKPSGKPAAADTKHRPPPLTFGKRVFKVSKR